MKKKVIFIAAAIAVGVIGSVIYINIQNNDISGETYEVEESTTSTETDQEDDNFYYDSGTLTGEESTSEEIIEIIEDDETETDEEREYYEPIGRVTSISGSTEVYLEMTTDSDIDGYLISPFYADLIEVLDEWVYVQNTDSGILGYVPIENVTYELYDIEITGLSTDYDVINERMKASQENDEYYTLAEEFIAGTTIYVDDPEDFLNYFTSNYCIVSPNSSVAYYDNNNNLTLSDADETLESRQETIEYVIETIGIEEYEDAYEEVVSAVERVKNALSYDENYGYSDTISAIEAGYGTCIHYTRALYIILNAEDIPCRIVTGTLDDSGYYYSWVEVEIDGEWYTVDPMEYDDTEEHNSDGFVSDDYIGNYIKTI